MIPFCASQIETYMHASRDHSPNRKQIYEFASNKQEYTRISITVNTKLDHCDKRMSSNAINVVAITGIANEH